MRRQSRRKSKRGPFSSDENEVDEFIPSATKPAKSITNTHQKRSTSNTRPRRNNGDLNDISQPQLSEETSTNSIKVDSSKNDRSKIGSDIMDNGKLSYSSNVQPKQEQNLSDLRTNVDTSYDSLNSLQQSGAKTFHLIFGLLLFGTGTMVLMTQLEHHSPLKSFLEGSFLKFKNNEYVGNITNFTRTHLELDTYVDIKEVNLNDEHFSVAVVLIGLTMVMFGGYFYMLSKRHDQESAEFSNDSNKSSKPPSTCDSSSLTRTPHHLPAQSTSNLTSISPSTCISDKRNPLSDTLAAPMSTMVKETYEHFKTQLAKYQKRVRERSLQAHVERFIAYIKSKWFRIVCIVCTGIVLLAARHAYIHRVQWRDRARLVSRHLGRLSLLLSVLIVTIQSMIYYFRNRYYSNRLIKFIASNIKSRLKHLHGASEYPVEFMEEDLVELITDYQLAHSQNTHSSRNSYFWRLVSSVAAGNHETTPSRVVHHHIGEYSHNADKIVGNDDACPSGQLSSTRPQFQEEPLDVPPELSERLTVLALKKLWSRVIVEVNKDKRVQMVTLIYHGVSRKCWRRLDLLPRVPTTQKHACAVSDTRGIASSGVKNHGFDQSEWETTIISSAGNDHPGTPLITADRFKAQTGFR